jgi:DNA-binding CsgD family transcriptional regulator
MTLSVNRAHARESRIDAPRNWLAEVPQHDVMLNAALDSFNIGIVICDGAARVVFTNAAARALNREGPLRLRARTIQAATIEDTRALTALIHDACAGAQWGAICLSGRDGVGALPALVRPLDAMESGRKGLALLALGSRAHNPWINEPTLAKLYQLSRTQASIAIAIFRGQSPEEIASERGIRISTVRTHLAAVFQRTRSHTQRDLVRLIGSLPPLLA